MPVVKKVLNSSVVLVSESGEKEFIVVSKGIGYGRKAGEQIDLTDDSQVFIPCTRQDRHNLLQLLEEIPSEYLEVTRRIVLYAEQQLNARLNPHIYLSLTDHIHFAAQRVKENIVITNRVFWEMKTFYAKEYKIGLYALQCIRQVLGLELPEEEAANISFHIVNAQHEDSQGDAMRDAKLIGQIVMLVTYSMKYQPDKESIHYSRFIAHLQFFAKRMFTGTMLESEDDFLFDQMRSGYPAAMNCAEKIRTLLLKEYNLFISTEEVAYLTVHIQRLTNHTI